MGFPPPRAAIITDNAGGMYPNNHVSSDHGQFPQYQGRDLYEWVEQIADLKRAGQLDQAEQLARGCMDAMTAHALKGNPAMEHYVIELAIIQRKRRDYRAEVDTISRWLALELPAERDELAETTGQSPGTPGPPGRTRPQPLDPGMAEIM